MAVHNVFVNSVNIKYNIHGDLFQDYPKLYRSIILKDLLCEKFGKGKETKRARRAKVKFRYFPDNKQKGER